MSWSKHVAFSQPIVSDGLATEASIVADKQAMKTDDILKNARFQITSGNTPVTAQTVASVDNFTFADYQDYQEKQRIKIYDRAAKAVVAIHTMVNEKPSSGSGIILSSLNGLIVTASHIVSSSKSPVFITLHDGKQIPARPIFTQNTKTDLTLLKADLAEYTPITLLPFANSDSAKVGQSVLAIGNPYGFERTLTTGIISRIDKINNLIQTDAAINPGNSGGPLLNKRGEIIGMNQSIYNPDGNQSNIGIGFAIPSNVIQQFLSAWLTQPHYQGQTALRSPAQPVFRKTPLFHPVKDSHLKTTIQNERN
ncbi:MAG: trypsin-like peptidase domain-containing protein [Cyanobacteria bacterium P01_H01_bin.74]